MSKSIRTIMWIIVGLLIATPSALAWSMNMQIAVSVRFPFMIAAGISILSLGIVILYLTTRTVTHKKLRRYLLQAGASAVGIVFFIILHNFLTPFFNEEPVTFILGIFVCPITFIIGTVQAFRLQVAPAT